MEYIVNTKCGAVRGTKVGNGVVAYKGIRYATAGRFEYPTEVTSWQGVYDATHYGACAFQMRGVMNEQELPQKAFYYNEFRRGETFIYSEDCLFLNVFTPEHVEGKLPVIVYIHGGSFTGGCAHEKHFDYPIWPTQGAIGVTINYRLGPLGFAVLPELKEEAGHTGNYGLYDQLTALWWVKHNIEAFGGDANNVTIMGQSAGAMSVLYHCFSPLSKGLFHKAVMSSGGGVSNMVKVGEASKRFDFWKNIFEQCGATTLQQIRQLPAEKIVEVWLKNSSASFRSACAPCIDGKMIVDAEPRMLAQGKQLKIPYMVGTTSHDVVAPLFFGMAKKWCKKQTTPAYLWFFERHLPGDNHGAWHSSDLWYWFGTLGNCWRPFEQKDRELSDEMASRLVAFAQSGNPNLPNGAMWQSGGKQALVLGDKPTAMGNPSKLKLWKTMLTVKAPGE